MTQPTRAWTHQSSDYPVQDRKKMEFLMIEGERSHKVPPFPEGLLTANGAGGKNAKFFSSVASKLFSFQYIAPPPLLNSEAQWHRTQKKKGMKQSHRRCKDINFIMYTYETQRIKMSVAYIPKVSERTIYSWDTRKLLFLIEPWTFIFRLHLITASKCWAVFAHSLKGCQKEHPLRLSEHPSCGQLLHRERSARLLYWKDLLLPSPPALCWQKRCFLWLCFLKRCQSDTTHWTVSNKSPLFHCLESEC